MCRFHEIVGETEAQEGRRSLIHSYTASQWQRGVWKSQRKFGKGGGRRPRPVSHNAEHLFTPARPPRVCERAPGHSTPVLTR
jgi:hypothetical protein